MKSIDNNGRVVQLKRYWNRNLITVFILIILIDAIGIYFSEMDITPPFAGIIIPVIVIVDIVFLILFMNYTFSNKTQFLFYKIDGDRVVGKKWLILNNLWGYLGLEFQISEIFQLIIAGENEEDLKKRKNGRFTGVFCDDQAYLLFFPYRMISDLMEMLPKELVAFGGRDEIKVKIIAWNTRNMSTPH